MTIDQWYAHPSFRKELEDALRIPAVQIAIQIAKDKVETPTPLPVGVDLIHFYATLGAKKEGHFECLANIRGLAEHRSVQAPVAKPWDNQAQAEALPKQAETPKA